MNRDPVVTRQISDAEWANHVNANPGHERHNTAVPAGWTCNGADGEACLAQSSSLSGE